MKMMSAEKRMRSARPPQMRAGCRESRQGVSQRRSSQDRE